VNGILGFYFFIRFYGVGMFRTFNVYMYVINKLIAYYPVLKRGNRLVKENKIDEVENSILKKHVVRIVNVVLKKSGVKVQKNGLENIPQNETVIFISNHQGNFDPVILLSALDGKRFGFIAKKEIEKIGILKMWMDFLGCIFIDRNNPREAIKAINLAIDKVQSGLSMAFFPEGTRSKCSEVGEFKTGVFKIIEKTKVKVVPVSINGTYKILESNNNKIKPANVSITFGTPIDTSNFEKSDFKELPNMIRNIIIKNIKGE